MNRCLIVVIFNLLISAFNSKYRYQNNFNINSNISILLTHLLKEMLNIHIFFISCITQFSLVFKEYLLFY